MIATLEEKNSKLKQTADLRAAELSKLQKHIIEKEEASSKMKRAYDNLLGENAT
jgi:hypothetical protein